MFKETPTRRYLRNRGISIDIPDCIRHHPALGHPYALGLHNAMVSRVWRWGETSATAVRCTFITTDGTKASLEPVRVIWGRYKDEGAGVWFGEPEDMLQIAEGVETALSAYELTSVPTVAALTDRHMGGLHIPDTVKRIVLAADHDKPGLKAAQDAARIYTARGIKTDIRAPEKEGQDWNDYLQEQKRGRAA